MARWEGEGPYRRFYEMGVDFSSTPSRLVTRDLETGKEVTMLEGKVLKIDGLELDGDQESVADVFPPPGPRDLTVTWRLSDEVMARLREAVLAMPPIADVFARMAQTITETMQALGWIPQDGVLKPLERPVRAFAGGKVSGWFAWDGTRWRACKRVAGHGWVYADQWKKYQERGFN